VTAQRLSSWRRTLGLLAVLLAGCILLLGREVAGLGHTGLKLFGRSEITAVAAVAPAASGRLQLQVTGRQLEGMRRAALIPDFGNRHLVRGQLPLWGQTADVAVSGEHAFVANYHRGLVVVDLSGPEPTICGSLALPGRSWRISIAGDLALVSALDQGLHLVDISRPDTPQLLATIPTRDRNWEASWDRGLLYLANGSEGLLVYDLADPAHPQQIAALDTASNTVDVLVAGSRIFLADSRRGITVARFQAGKLLGEELLTLPYGYWKLAYDPTHQIVYGAAGSDGLTIISVPEAGRAEMLEHHSDVGFCNSLLLDGDRLHAGTSSGTISYTLGADGRPLQTGEVQTPSRVQGIGRYRQLLVMACLEHGLELVEATRPEPQFRPRLFSSLRWISDVDLAPGSDLLVSTGGSLALLSDDSVLQFDDSPVFRNLNLYSMVWGGERWVALRIGSNRLQLSRTGGPIHETSSLVTRGVINDVLIREDLLLVADLHDGLLIYDLGGDVPRLVGTFRSSGEALDLVLEGTLLYLADGLGGLKIVDLANPRQPVLLGSSQWRGKVGSVAVDAGIAYVAVEEEGLVTLDCRDPRHPVVRGQAVDDNDVGNLTLHGDQLIVAHRTRPVSVYRLIRGTLQLLQHLDPSTGKALLVDKDALVCATSDGTALFRKAPEGHYLFEGPLDSALYALSLARAGDDLLVLDQNHMLVTYPWNGGYPGAPTESLSRGKAVVARSGTSVFLANQNLLQRLDISRPGAPVLLSREVIDGEVSDLLYHDGLLMAAMGRGGLQIYNVENPTRISPLARLPVDDIVMNLARYNDLLVLSNFRDGIKLIDISDPRSPRLVSKADYPEPLKSFSQAMDVEVRGHYCYVADGANGVAVVDLADPRHPEIVNRVEIPGHAVGLNLSGNRLFVIDGKDGVDVFEIDGRGELAAVAAVDFPKGVRACWQRGSSLLLASYSNGLYVIPCPVEAEAIEGEGNTFALRFARQPAAGYYCLQLSGRDLQNRVERIVYLDAAGGVSLVRGGL